MDLNTEFRKQFTLDINAKLNEDPFSLKAMEPVNLGMIASHLTWKEIFIIFPALCKSTYAIVKWDANFFKTINSEYYYA